MRKFLIATILAFTASQVRAAPASSESVEQLLVLIKAESLVETMFAGADQTMRRGVQEAIGARALNVEQQRIVDAIPQRFVGAMRQEFNWPAMKPAYLRIYQESFEQDEIDGLIAFYGSRAGQAFIAKMPVVMQKSMELSQEQMRTLLPRMIRIIDDAMREAKIAE